MSISCDSPSLASYSAITLQKFTLFDVKTRKAHAIPWQELSKDVPKVDLALPFQGLYGLPKEA